MATVITYNDSQIEANRDVLVEATPVMLNNIMLYPTPNKT